MYSVSQDSLFFFSFSINGITFATASLQAFTQLLYLVFADKVVISTYWRVEYLFSLRLQSYYGYQ